ncbi:MAG: hypothetical protein K4445_11575 [Deltaproteobacteria bacterium]|nr:hypothetical protein [Syntrophaceae bacterium]
MLKIVYLSSAVSGNPEMIRLQNSLEKRRAEFSNPRRILRDDFGSCLCACVTKRLRFKLALRLAHQKTTIKKKVAAAEAAGPVFISVPREKNVDTGACLYIVCLKKKTSRSAARMTEKRKPVIKA